MNRRTFLASIAAIAMTPRLIAAQPVRLRVLSYNIRHGQGLDRKLDLERIAAVIRQAKPDLVSLQEVDRATTRSGKVDQAAKLAELTGLKSVFGEAMAYGGGGYGNAILSRFDIGHTFTIALPAGPKEEPRCLLVANIGVPAGDGARRIYFGATHLNHRSAEERLQQASKIVAETAIFARDQTPTLIAGDLNAGPDSKEIGLLTSVYVDATAKPVAAADAATRPAQDKLLTFPADRPRVKIDYVLAGPAASWKVLEATVLQEAVASDHRPVLAVLELAN